MKTVIYLDELLLTNFVIGAAMLLGAGLLSAQRCQGLRLCAGASAASLSTLILLAPELPAPLSLLYKILTCTLAIAVTYGCRNKRSFLRLCVWYCLLNFLLCGAVILPGVHTNNGSLYLPLSPGRLLLCCAGVSATLQLALYCFGHTQTASLPATLELADGTAVPLQAFYDTGFSIQAPLSRRAVVLVRYPVIRQNLSSALCTFLDAYFSGTAASPTPELNLQFLPCSTIAGRCLLPAMPAAGLSIGKKSTDSVLVAFCDAPPDGSWDLLLGSDTADLLRL